jgi:hypothetical protein
MLSISISQGDIDFATSIAHDRNNKPQSTNKRFTKGHSDFSIHFCSALAEVAWAKLTGWPLDLSIKMGDGGIDFTNNGVTYQIKARDTSRFALGKPKLPLLHHHRRLLYQRGATTNYHHYQE